MIPFTKKNKICSELKLKKAHLVGFATTQPLV